MRQDSEQVPDHGDDDKGRCDGVGMKGLGQGRDIRSRSRNQKSLPKTVSGVA